MPCLWWLLYGAEMTVSAFLALERSLTAWWLEVED